MKKPTLTPSEILRQGKRTIRIEADAVRRLGPRLGDSFVRAVELLRDAPGKAVVTGVGKSGLIGQKIAATLTSTGTPAIFLHSAEAAHGDLGMLCRGDILLAISNSGEAEEILKLIPAVRRLGVTLITLTGRPKSSLARAGDVNLDVAVTEEACPLGLAPTASTTAALAMGDALAVALLKMRGFREEDFALIHPGGKLGRRWLKVSDLMHSGQALPMVRDDIVLKNALVEISHKKLGVTTVVDRAGKLRGIITDGDLRRMIERGVDFYAARVKDVMSKHPKVIDPDDLGARAVQVMEAHAITALVVVDGARRPVGIIHLHDLLKAGVV
jgi:arabinose-5-phosphate isomerase